MTPRTCGTSPDCYHTACHACDRLLRSNNKRLEDHQATVIGTIDAQLCARCMERGHPPADSMQAKDERHILLTDDDMTRIMSENPVMFTWHARRRKRLKVGEYA